MNQFGIFTCAFALSISTAVHAQDMLESLTQPQLGYTAQRVSSFDTSGGNADFFGGIEPGETRVLANIDGPGMITHIWCTINAEKFYGRKVVLRMFWDDEKDPSVLAPLNDFFAMGHGIDAPLASIPITTTAEGRSKNSYFKMPFNKSARIEITNEGLESVGSFYFYIDYRKYDKPHQDAMQFHARYRQEYPTIKGKDYLVCEAKGRGHYVGTVLSYESHYAGWYGEGDDKFFIDGETSPSLHGTGTEDYLNDAWGMWKGNSPFYGTSIFEGTPYIYPKDTRYTSYRWHITDPIPFTKSLKFEIEHYGVGLLNGSDYGFTERFDNISSMAYWYQAEPHLPMDPLPPVHERLSKELVDEIAMLKFFGDAGKPQTKESIVEVRAQYEAAKSNPLYEGRESRIAAVIAGAEYAAGNKNALNVILRDSITPFVSRDLISQKNLKELLYDHVGTSAPLLVRVEDGSVKRTEVEGEAAIQTDPDNKKRYIYFSLPQDSPFREKVQDLSLEIGYFSSGEDKEQADTFRVDYDASTAANDANAYRGSDSVTKNSERGWHTVTIDLKGATLTGKQNNRSDFRISDDNNGVETIRSVTVKAGQ